MSVGSRVETDCVMEANYIVVEYRGCGIEYPMYQGSRAECEQWLLSNCWLDVDLMGDINWVNNDPSCVNGNGFAFRYSIRGIGD